MWGFLTNALVNVGLKMPYIESHTVNLAANYVVWNEGIKFPTEMEQAMDIQIDKCIAGQGIMSDIVTSGVSNYKVNINLESGCIITKLHTNTS